MILADIAHDDTVLKMHIIYLQSCMGFRYIFVQCTCRSFWPIPLDGRRNQYIYIYSLQHHAKVARVEMHE